MFSMSLGIALRADGVLLRYNPVGAAR
jgi:hypothetical protein